MLSIGQQQDLSSYTVMSILSNIPKYWLALLLWALAGLFVWFLIYNEMFNKDNHWLVTLVFTILFVVFLLSAFIVNPDISYVFANDPLQAFGMLFSVSFLGAILIPFALFFLLGMAFGRSFLGG